MNGPEIILAEVLGAGVVLAVLGCLAVAREWIAVSVSVRTVPKAKRHRCAAAAATVPAAPAPAAPVQEIAPRRDAA